jgi:hypothetical protein
VDDELDISEIAESWQSLLKQAPDALSYPQIDERISELFDGLTAEQIEAVAKEAGITVSGIKTRMIDDFRRVAKELKVSHERTQFKFEMEPPKFTPNPLAVQTDKLLADADRELRELLGDDFAEERPMADGGEVEDDPLHSAKPGEKDKIPAKLQPGEVVIKKEDVAAMRHLLTTNGRIGGTGTNIAAPSGAGVGKIAGPGHEANLANVLGRADAFAEVFAQGVGDAKVGGDFSKRNAETATAKTTEKITAPPGNTLAFLAPSPQEVLIGKIQEAHRIADRLGGDEGKIHRDAAKGYTKELSLILDGGIPGKETDIAGKPGTPTKLAPIEEHRTKLQMPGGATELLPGGREPETGSKTDLESPNAVPDDQAPPSPVQSPSTGTEALAETLGTPQVSEGQNAGEPKQSETKWPRMGPRPPPLPADDKPGRTRSGRQRRQRIASPPPGMLLALGAAFGSIGGHGGSQSLLNDIMRGRSTDRNYGRSHRHGHGGGLGGLGSILSDAGEMAEQLGGSGRGESGGGQGDIGDNDELIEAIRDLTEEVKKLAAGMGKDDAVVPSAEYAAAHAGGASQAGSGSPHTAGVPDSRAEYGPIQSFAMNLVNFFRGR